MAEAKLNDEKARERGLQNQSVEFGFQKDTKELNTCIAQLKLANEQADIMRRQAAAIDANRRAEQIEREEIKRQQAIGRALLGIGAGLLNPPQPSSAGNMFKTCYYSVAGETVPYPVSSASICPASRDFGGITGFLQ